MNLHSTFEPWNNLVLSISKTKFDVCQGLSNLLHKFWRESICHSNLCSAGGSDDQKIKNMQFWALAYLKLALLNVHWKGVKLHGADEGDPGGQHVDEVVVAVDPDPFQLG